jgi:hypothetical protein
MNFMTYDEKSGTYLCDDKDIMKFKYDDIKRTVFANIVNFKIDSNPYLAMNSILQYCFLHL